MRCSVPLALVMGLAVAACGRNSPTESLGPDPSGPSVGARDASEPRPTPDLGLPEPGDGGSPSDPDSGGDDGGEPVDLGTLDTGVGPDASVPDIGRPPDSGTTSDSGTTPDSGTVVDSGVPNDAGTPECSIDDDCGFREVCEPNSQTCVRCLNDDDCGFGRICDTAGGYACRVPCFSNGGCLGGDVCDPSLDACVECLQDADCGSGERCLTSQKECVDCLGNSDCALVPGQPICSLSNNECTGCTTDADCNGGELCDDGTCLLPMGRDLCAPCEGDAQCGGPDDLCLGLGPGGAFDRGCALDCSNASCPNGYECVDARNGQARQCRPSYGNGLQGWTPTCTAMRNLGESCQSSSIDLDPGCGITGVRDARCEPNGGGDVCTVYCTQPSECPQGFACVLGPQGTGACLR